MLYYKSIDIDSFHYKEFIKLKYITSFIEILPPIRVMRANAKRKAVFIFLASRVNLHNDITYITIWLSLI